MDAEADEADWRALATRTLKGASLDGLDQTTAEGLPIRPLYAPAPARLLAGRALDQTRPWDMRVRAEHPDPVQAHARALEALEGGASSISVRCGDGADLATRLEGVVLDLAPVALDAGFDGPRAADALAILGKASPRAPLDFALDPLSAFAVAGLSPGPVQSHLVSAAETAARLAQTYPVAQLFRVNGRVVHEAGGGEALEIAFAAASGLAYARAMVRAGMDVERAFAGMTFELAVDHDYFLSIAKLRAARAALGRIAVACGAAPVVRLAASSSCRMLAAEDAWTNMIRLTIAGFAGAAGGADVLTLGCFSDPLGSPAALARRQSRNIQLILMEEAHIGRVADPAAGSGYVETLTDAFARKAWAQFQAIEARGGVIAALRDGFIAEEVAAAIATRADQPVVGVSAFQSLDKAPIAVDETAARFGPPVTRLPGPDSHCARLEPAT